MAKKNPTTPGKEFTKTIERGKNKGDRVRFRVGPSGKPFPVQVLLDLGGNSTLRNNSGVVFGKRKKERRRLPLRRA